MGSPLNFVIHRQHCIKKDLFVCPDVWFVFMKAIWTNNDIEGRNHRINYGLGSGFHMFKLILLLHTEANLIPLHTNFLSYGKALREQSKVAKSREVEKNSPASSRTYVFIVCICSCNSSSKQIEFVSSPILDFLLLIIYSTWQIKKGCHKS